MAELPLFDVGYGDGVGIARSAPPPEPLPRPVGIDKFLGQWVAVKAGIVIAGAPTGRELVMLVKGMGADGADATVEFVSPPSDSFMVGAG